MEASLYLFYEIIKTRWVDGEFLGLFILFFAKYC